MSIRNCIKNAFDQGAITLEEKQRFDKRLDDLIKSIPSTREAKEIMIREMEAEAAERERRALLAEVARKRLVGDAFGHHNKKGEQDVAAGFKWIHGHNGEGSMIDVENLRMVILGEFHSQLSELLHEFRKGAITGDRRRQGAWVGNSEVKVRLENVVRELFGESTGDARAKALAVSWEKVSERARQEFNALGGAVGKLDKWGLPQWHDREALLNFGRAKWVKYLMEPGVLDRERMVSHYSGLKLTDAELKEALETSWDRITTDGWYDREVGMVQTGKGALYKQHQDHRFMHFASADAWLKYARDFGNPDPYNSMMGHLGTMARDIAAMRVFGPNPEAMRTYLANLVRQHLANARPSNVVREEQEAELAKLASDLARHGGRQGWEAAYDVLMGTYKKLRSELDELRDTGGRGPRPPNAVTRARTQEESASLMRPVADKIREMEAAYSRFGVWLDENPHMRDNGGVDAGPAVTVARERMREIFDDLAEEIALPTGNWQGRADRSFWTADQMWGLYKGSLTAPVDSQMANGFRNIRNVLVAARLGSAIVSAVTDMGFGKATRAFIGSERSGVHHIVSDMTTMFSAQTRMEMIRSGQILDTAVHNLHQQARYAGALNTNEITGYLADRVIHLQGLQAWTQAGKWAFSMEFQGLMADARVHAWDQLPDLVRGALDRHGITPAEWRVIRSADVHALDARSAGILRPNEVEAIGGLDLARKYQMMILRERTRAVPEPTLRARAIMTGGSRPGTILGETIRSASQFKSFGVTVLMLHGGRMMEQYSEGGWRTAAGYAVPLLISTTVLGAVAVQLKELVAGRDPRKMDDPRFWAASLIQGGGMGIMGDFLNSSQNRFGGGFAGTVAGPLAGEIDKVLQYTIGNAQQAADGKTTNIGRETSDAIRRLAPGASLVWTRLAAERLLFDRIQKALDPDSHAAFQRRMDTRKRDYGVGFWWEPGEPAAKRAPDFGGVVGKP